MVTSGLMARRRGKKGEHDVNLFLLPTLEKTQKTDETPKTAKGRNKLRCDPPIELFRRLAMFDRLHIHAIQTS